MPLSTFQLAKLLSGVWCVEENAANKYQELVSNFFNGVTDKLLSTSPTQSTSRPYAVAPDGSINFWYQYDANGMLSGVHNTQSIVPNSVIVVPIAGAMIKDDYCGALGTESLGFIMQSLDSEPNVKGFVLDIDSPGGSVDGLDNFANIIYNLQKPTAAFANGMMASAALYTGVATNRVFASNATAIIGSIGTMMSYTDSRGYQEKTGIKRVSVYAPQSSQKNEEFNALESGNTDLIKNNILRPYAEQFIQFVKMARPQTAEQPVFTGKTFMASDAIKVGLVDEIGSLNDAIDFVRNSNFNQSNPNMKITKSFIAGLAWVSAQLGFSNVTDTTGETEVTSEMLTTLNSNAEALQSQLSAKEEAFSALNAELEALKAEKASSDALVASSSKRVADLEAVLQGKPSNALGQPDEKGNVSVSENPFAQFASEL